MAQLLGGSSSTQEVVGLIPGQGTHLGWGFDPRLGRVQEVTRLTLLSHTSVSPLFPFLSLKSIKTYPRVRIKKNVEGTRPWN